MQMYTHNRFLLFVLFCFWWTCWIPCFSRLLRRGIAQGLIHLFSERVYGTCTHTRFLATQNVGKDKALTPYVNTNESILFCLQRTAWKYLIGILSSWIRRAEYSEKHWPFVMSEICVEYCLGIVTCGFLVFSWKYSLVPFVLARAVLLISSYYWAWTAFQEFDWTVSSLKPQKE